MNIDHCIKSISSSWRGLGGASDIEMDNVERGIQLALPQDFRKFMKWSGGGAVDLPCIHLSIWPLGDLIALNKEYQIGQYLGDQVIAIGSDGGPICFLLDYRTDKLPSFSSVNFGDLDPAEIKFIAPSFALAVELAIKGKLIDDNL